MKEAYDNALDQKISDVLNKDFALPKSVEAAKEEAFSRIRAMESKQQETEIGKQAAGNRRGVSGESTISWFWKACAGLAASAAAFSAVCIANPAFAAKLPLVGHVFEKIGDSLGFSGDYEKYAKTVEAPAQEQTEEAVNSTEGAQTGYTKSSNGLDITLSEIYCSTSALYMSLIFESQEPFPDTMIDQQGNPIVSLQGTLQTDFADQEFLVFGMMDGRFVDDRTYAGVYRYDLSEFAYNGEDGRVITPEIPDQFAATLTLSQLRGDKAVSTRPEMPEDIRGAYEAAMAENGLGLTDEDYRGFTEEQKEIEFQLYKEMMAAYDQRYPEAAQVPNSYENWWMDGDWSFTCEVSRDASDTVTVEIGDVNEEGVGLVSVTKTPFEITIQDGENPDTFAVALDENGDILPYGGSGNANTYAVQNKDISKIDVYICDYVEYMDELKGYYWSEDYEEKKETKTFKELLDERALYHKEISFEQ
ncbi:MAG: DUF4179 domain-containing protein [Eubacteriales bacterium]|nr:DUF4179 domain-containing protein [Eubacteriales bacterium]